MSDDRGRDRLTILELEYQVVAGRLATIDGELQVINKRLAGIEARFVHVDERLETMATSIDRLSGEIGEMMAEIRAMHTETLRRLGGSPS